MLNTAMLLRFIAARESIRCYREYGRPAPWTEDPILQEWSFTNVEREQDRTTRWVAVNWRTPNRDDPDLFFAMAMACFVNNIETLEQMGYPVPFDADHFRAVMKDRAERGDRLYGPAYMIRADKKYRTTAEYQTVRVFTPLWRARSWMRPHPGETLARYYSRLSEHHGFGGGFMPGQVIAYLKYAPPLCDAADWSSFVVSGPGSRRGLNRVLGYSPGRVWSSEDEWRSAFNQLRVAVMPELEECGLNLHAQDLQSVLCEVDKYERVRLGEGKPRRRFQPSPDPLPGAIDLDAAAE